MLAILEGIQCSSGTAVYVTGVAISCIRHGCRIQVHTYDTAGMSYIHPEDTCSEEGTTTMSFSTKMRTDTSSHKSNARCKPTATS